MCLCCSNSRRELDAGERFCLSVRLSGSWPTTTLSARPKQCVVCVLADGVGCERTVGSGRPKATGLSGRRVWLLLTKMEKECVGAWQAKGRCSGQLFCPVYMGRN